MIDFVHDFEYYITSNFKKKKHFYCRHVQLKYEFTFARIKPFWNINRSLITRTSRNIIDVYIF